MRIDRLFSLGLPTISFEFFPPKNEGGWAQLYQAIGELHSLKPSYVSVTYGAGGSTRGKTLDLVSRIQNELKIRSMAHLTCVGHTADELGKILDDLWNAGIRNVLALRGDPPAGQTNFVATEGGFSNADGLTKFITSRRNAQDFCVGVAGYPEGHPQCLNLTRDMEHLQRKVDNGADFVVTQLFFDNADFYRFRDQARAAGIKVPLVAGIMPIGNVGQIKRFVSMCGSKIPHSLLTKLESLEADPEAVYAAGVDYATQQCKDLLANGCEGIHFYTLNRSKATVQIVKALNPKHAA
jgi:methylenetetrahydrofolate reductase (NADPH)